MEELEKTARELILTITEKTLKSLKDKGLLKEPSKLQMLCSSPEMTSLIKKLSAPKYDPCRKFREGDKVRVVEKDGRTVHDPLNGGLWTVSRNERTGGAHEMSILVHLFYEDEKIAYQISVPFYLLELVTPVEEQVPYSVRESDAFDIVREGKIVMTIPFTEDDYYTFEQAQAAAKAERDRLNDEWRKEQK